MNKAELGSALRALRQASGRLSKIENGSVMPSVVDVEQILTAVGVSEAVKAEYMSVARAAATEATAWRLYRRLGYHRKQQQIQAVESRTTLLRLFQPALVPGLLQTPEYAQAVLGRKQLTPDQLVRAVGARLARQSILYEPGRQLRFIVTEPVLRWRIVPPLVMAGQLDRLVAVSRLPSVDLRIVPLSVRQTDFPNHSFSIKDDRMVTVETVHAELTVSDPRDVSLYIEKFERFAEQPLRRRVVWGRRRRGLWVRRPAQSLVVEALFGTNPEPYWSTWPPSSCVRAGMCPSGLIWSVPPICRWPS
ncbi:helix-turn-helix transcriptional regulator [Streptomyces sp. NPDC046881]|uniref:helix-turn-helix domain-containing protein n=1 Tax=Streptomyces sp. NPDC046881 TaxID=3155374 RepID=UPI0033F47534